MKNIKPIFLVAIIFLGFQASRTTASAQDAEYNLIRRTYTMNSDGSIDFRFRKELKLLRNRAITAYADKGETFILYNPKYDKLTINESYTIRKDGSRVQTPANAFIDQLPSECADCGRFNGIRERVVVHTALEYDCIIVLDYTIHHKGTAGWEENIEMTQDCPVKKYEVIVDAPENTEWSSKQYGPEKNIKTIKDGHSLHIVATDLRQSIIENYSAPTSTGIYLSLGSTRIVTPNVSVADSPEVENIIAELHDKDSMVWATNIRDYVADYIHTVKIEPRYHDYSVSSASETFLSNCGTESDKNNLLAAILRQAGFDASYSGNMVELTITENGNRLTYLTTAASKRPFRLEGRAIDEQREIDIIRQLPWKGTDIGGGYSQMKVPTEEGSISIDPAWLTSKRESPLKVRNCNESYRYIIAVPTGSRLVKPVSVKYSKKGIGSITISTRQVDSNTIEVIRKLDINVEDGVVSVKQYKAFRKMMQDWKLWQEIIIK